LKSSPGSRYVIMCVVFDDEERGAVFDAAAGVLEFGFAQHVAARFFGELLQPDERRLANCFGVLA
jgi:hypothetical protein